MKIIFDNIIYSLQKSGGISTYWTELVCRYTYPCSCLNYSGTEHNICFNNLPQKIKSEKKPSCLFLLQRYIDVSLIEKTFFMFHSSYYRICKSKKAINITTVHDFTYELYRHDVKSIFHKLQKKHAVMHSHAVICVSENTKSDLLRFYPDYTGKIAVIYHGYSKEYTSMPHIKRENMIVFVGFRSSYKRFDLAVRIAHELPDAVLCIVGGGSLTENEKELLNKYEITRYVHKGYVSNTELAIIYNKARCLLYTSDYEGFGIPILEAQACGCPVVCQPVSSIPEVAASAGVYIDEKDFAGSLARVKRLYDEETFSDISQKGLENVKRFSWDICADWTQQFYHEIYDEYVR